MTMFRPSRNFQQSEKVAGSRVVVNKLPAGRTRRGRRQRIGGSTGLPSIIEAYIDPWSSCADGVRYPDDFRGNSGTFNSTYETTIAVAPAAGGFTDANMIGVVPQPGTALFLVTPDPSNTVVTGVSGTNGAGFYAGVPKTFNWPNGILFTGAPHSLNAFGPGTGILNNDIPMPNVPTLRALYSGARLVAGGAKVTSVMNFTNVSGTIHVAPVFVNTSRETSAGPAGFPGFANPTLTEMQNGWQTALPQNLSDMINLPGYMEYPLSSLEADEILAIFKRYGTESLLFKPTATAWGMDDNSLGTLASRYGDADSPDSIGHYSLCVFIDGVTGGIQAGPALAGTPLVELEVRNHYECQPNPLSSLTTSLGSGASLITPSPPSQPLLLAASDNLASDVSVVRCVDSAGVEEGGFVEEVVSLWRNACTVATSVVSAVNVASGLLAALTV